MISKHIKQILIIFCAIVSTGILINVISAYFVDTGTITNTLTVGGNNIEIVENFDPIEPQPGTSFTKDVSIKNKGPCACYVRVKAVFSDSEIGDYSTIDWNTVDWNYNPSDGYYYYIYELENGTSTSSLFTTVALSEDMPESSIKDFDIIVYAESYQSYGFDTYTAAWTNYQKNK